MTKKSIDMNNLNHRSDKPVGSPNKKVNKELESASGNWLNTDTRGQINKDHSNYNQKNQRQNELASSLDGHGFAASAPQQKGNDWQPTYVNKDVRKTQQQKQAFLASSFAGHDSQKYHES